MRLLNLLFRRETAAPILALAFASAASVALVIARVFFTGHIRYGFLVWNLFLAWIPLLFAMLACEKFHAGTGKGWRFFGLVGAWLLFFPNASYIFTDIIHVANRAYHVHFWVDLMLVLVCALTGLVVGFVSLYLMQSIAARMFGRLMSWVFVAVVAGLSSIGVYLGRFLRFNSWDVFLRPGKIYRGLDAWWDTLASRSTIGFVVLFATFLFLAYLMLYALTHLSPTRMTEESQRLNSA